MKHRSLLIVILAALSMLGALSIDAYLPALPAIAKGFSTSLTAVQQSLTVYTFAFGFMTLLYGTLSDSFGRRIIILASLVCYLFSTIGTAVAPTLEWLLLFRFLQGLSAGAGAVVGRAIVGDLFSGAEAQRIMSWVSVVFGLAPAAAPILGGWLLAAFGWRAIFVFIAIFTLLLFVACAIWLGESLPHEKRHPFELRSIVSAYCETASHGPFVLQSISIALAFFGLMVYVGSAPAYVINLLHLTVTDFGWLFVPLIGGMTIGSLLAARLSHALSSTTIIRLGFATMLLAVLANGVYTALCPISIPWALLPIVVYSLGAALATPAMTVISLELFPKTRGLAASLQTFVFMMAFTLGSGLVCPLLFDSAFKLALGGIAAAAGSIGCWQLSLWLRVRQNEASTEKATVPIAETRCDPPGPKDDPSPKKCQPCDYR